MSKNTHFGFKNVLKEEKEGLVASVFSSVAPKYDLMNDLMSGGIHRLWKSELISLLNPICINDMLDVAGGTGDISFKFMKKADDFGKSPNVTVCDINPEMIEIGKKRAIDKGIIKNLNWVCGNAEKLPFESESFDACTIAFGLRNVTNIDKALCEMHRVLKPNGIFLCLEFSKVVLPILDKFYDIYSFEIIPKIGKIVANDKASYQYLVESIRKFPKQEDLIEMMKKAGFTKTKYTNLTGGIAAIHTGRKE